MKLSELLGFKWNYQMTESLMKLLFDKSKREELFKQYLSGKPDLSKDTFLSEFQSEFADRSKLKQDYTPSSISQIVASISGEAETILDICAGTGALTIAKWYECPSSKFYLQEYSKEAIAVLLFNLAVRGMNAEVQHCDVLTGEVFNSYRVLPSKEGNFSDIEKAELNWSELKVDCVISNPPYSLSWVPKEYEYLNGYSLPPKSKADYAFVLRGVNFLNKNGRACFVLPNGVLFRGQKEGEIRKKLIEQNFIDSVIGLPEKLFLATQIPVVLLCFNKNRENQDILFINAEKQYEKGKAINLMNKEQVLDVISLFNERKDKEKLSKLVNKNEIEKNAFNLNLSRYIDNFEPEEVPDLLETAKELLEIKEKLEEKTQDFLIELSKLELRGTVKEQKEFEQAKKILHKALSPSSSQLSEKVYLKLKKVSIGPQAQVEMFSKEELEDVKGFIEDQEKKIALLKKIKRYFLSKMFV